MIQNSLAITQGQGQGAATVLDSSMAAQNYVNLAAHTVSAWENRYKEREKAYQGHLEDLQGLREGVYVGHQNHIDDSVANLMDVGVKLRMNGYDINDSSNPYYSDYQSLYGTALSQSSRSRDIKKEVDQQLDLLMKSDPDAFTNKSIEDFKSYLGRPVSEQLSNQMPRIEKSPPKEKAINLREIFEQGRKDFLEIEETATLRGRTAEIAQEKKFDSIAFGRAAMVPGSAFARAVVNQYDSMPEDAKEAYIASAAIEGGSPVEIYLDDFASQFSQNTTDKTVKIFAPKGGGGGSSKPRSFEVTRAEVTTYYDDMRGELEGLATSQATTAYNQTEIQTNLKDGEEETITGTIKKIKKIAGGYEVFIDQHSSTQKFDSIKALQTAIAQVNTTMSQRQVHVDIIGKGKSNIKKANKAKAKPTANIDPLDF